MGKNHVTTKQSTTTFGYFKNFLKFRILKKARWIIWYNLMVMDLEPLAIKYFDTFI